jgi:hypothetical protein
MPAGFPGARPRAAEQVGEPLAAVGEEVAGRRGLREPLTRSLASAKGG